MTRGPRGGWLCVAVAMGAWSGALFAGDAPKGKTGGQESSITLPRGWTSETRSVKVIAPGGHETRQIVYYRNSIGMEFVRLPAGEFWMGSPDQEAGRTPDEGPRHKVRITRPFYMSAREVTQEEYDQKAGTNPARFKGGRNPAECVSWYDAMYFCRWLEGRDGGIVEYRLPTEAEWEYACRAGTDTPFPSGATITSEVANYDARYSYGNVSKGEYRAHTIPVGSCLPNAFGLFDMCGNVWEWCMDFYAADFYAKSPMNDPTRVETSLCYVVRGGSWDSVPDRCRSAAREKNVPNYRGTGCGFRVVYVPVQ